jgi:hypothetical protein
MQTQRNPARTLTNASGGDGSSPPQTPCRPRPEFGFSCLPLLHPSRERFPDHSKEVDRLGS